MTHNMTNKKGNQFSSVFECAIFPTKCLHVPTFIRQIDILHAQVTLPGMYLSILEYLQYLLPLGTSVWRSTKLSLLLSLQIRWWRNSNFVVNYIKNTFLYGTKKTIYTSIYDSWRVHCTVKIFRFVRWHIYDPLVTNNMHTPIHWYGIAHQCT